MIVAFVTQHYDAYDFTNFWPRAQSPSVSDKKQWPIHRAQSPTADVEHGLDAASMTSTQEHLDTFIAAHRPRLLRTLWAYDPRMMLHQASGAHEENPSRISAVSPIYSPVSICR